ncbi:hypothetical protein CAEBREN_04208 [Caenorhabditis brenneri]|uniref:Uncharacterized protein n=1 Tax=Caenorhabditis brenneri TaxID=135651 RepID=G0ML08_CAEBE|nr:hypothetical protein CAEBREN_04208 [Caenorhabditis brenneri]
MLNWLVFKKCCDSKRSILQNSSSTESSNSSSTTETSSETSPKTSETTTNIPFCIPFEPTLSTNDSIPSKCAFSLNIPPSTHKYIGGFIIFCFIIGQTIHYFYLEEKKARELKRSTESVVDPATQNLLDENRDEEEKERRERLAYGISTNTYLVAESKTPGGRVTKVLEKRRRAVAPPITPAYGAASINGLYESRTKTVQKEEAMICQIQITIDKWGRGNELISLINDTDVPPALTTVEEKARYAMELVQQHVEKMTEQKVFIHGFLEDRTRILCGSENLETEIFSEVRLELKLEMTSPVHLLMSVFSVKMEPQIEQPKTAPPARVSELTSIPNKETPKADILATPASHLDKKMRSTVTNSLEEGKQQLSSSRPNKVMIQSPDRRERRDSSKRKGGAKKTSDLSDLVPLLQQVQTSQGNEKKEKQRTPKESPMPTTPEKPSSGQMPPTIKKKKNDSSSGQGSSGLQN